MDEIQTDFLVTLVLIPCSFPLYKVTLMRDSAVNQVLSSTLVTSKCRRCCSVVHIGVEGYDHQPQVSDDQGVGARWPAQRTQLDLHSGSEIIYVREN